MTLATTTLLQLKKALDSKQISPSEVRDYYLGRIQKYEDQINSFVTQPNQIETTKDGNETIPIAIKDNFCTDGIRTTASSKVLDSFMPPYNATVVQKLLDNNFSVFGKTNMDAWAHGSSTETSDFGPTKNPWDTTRAAGGSSGGAAAALAMGFTPAAIGSETAGSIRQPAAWCGVVGLKPSYGRVSRYGVIAMGSSWDCPGPLTHSVEDASYILSLLSGADPYDATSTNSKPYISPLTENRSKKKFTIGVCDDYLEGLQDDTRKAYENMLQILEKLGHTVKSVKLISPNYAISVYTILQRAEVSSNLSRYDGVRFGNDRTAFGQEAKRRIMLGTYTLSHGYYDAYYKQAEKVRGLIINDFDEAFKTVDAIVAPTAPTTAITLGEFEKYPFFGELMDKLNEPAAAAGIPALNLPGGLDSNNLPIGIQFMGRYMDEETLVVLGDQIEKETGFFGMREQLMKKYPDA